jgi:hypothetical protein
MTRIVTRADDFGSFKTANKAIVDCVNDGIVKNVSIMVVTDYWREASTVLTGKDICLGLHFCINAEWTDIDWKPISPTEQVLSLVNENGCFRTNIREQEHASLDEIMLECKAQLELARSEGLNIEYLDTHCGFEWFNEGELRNRLNVFCKKEGLVYNGIIDFERLSSPKTRDIDGYVGSIKNLSPDKTYLWIGHPCYPVVEIQNVMHPGLEPGDVANDRDLQRDLFLNNKIVDVCKKNDVQTIKYTEI